MSWFFEFDNMLFTTKLQLYLNTELVTGKLEFGIHFDDAFNTWKHNKLKVEVELISENWGICKDWLLKSVKAFATSKPTIIPYIDEITKSVDYEKASDKSAGNKLKHIMTLTKILPVSIMELKLKYE